MMHRRERVTRGAVLMDCKKNEQKTWIGERRDIHGKRGLADQKSPSLYNAKVDLPTPRILCPIYLTTINERRV